MEEKGLRPSPRLGGHIINFAWRSYYNYMVINIMRAESKIMCIRPLSANGRSHLSISARASARFQTAVLGRENGTRIEPGRP